MHRPPLSSCFPSIKQNDCAFGLILLTPTTRDQHSRQFPGWPRVLPFARSVCLLARVAALHHPASSGITTAAGKPPPPAISDAAPGWSDDAPGTQRVATLNPSCIRLQEAAEFPRFVALLCASSTQHHMKAKSRVQSREGLPVVLVRGRCWAIGRSAVNVPLLIHTQAFRTEGQKSCGYRLPRCPSFQAVSSRKRTASPGRRSPTKRPKGPSAAGFWPPGNPRLRLKPFHFHSKDPTDTTRDAVRPLTCWGRVCSWPLKPDLGGRSHDPRCELGVFGWYRTTLEPLNDNWSTTNNLHTTRQLINPRPRLATADGGRRSFHGTMICSPEMRAA